MKTQSQGLLAAFSACLLLAGCFDGGSNTPRNAAGSEPVAPAKLAVAVSGMGSVASSPSGIDCGSDCSGEYPASSTVVLKATPASGSRFAGWSGACTNSSGDCTMTLDGDRTVGALFSPIPSYALTVSVSGAGAVRSAPAGIDCGSDCSESYTENTVVGLEVTAAAGSRFAGWSGACSGTGACSVTMDAAKTVGALFEAIPSYALTVNRSGAGQVVSSPAGINCPDACSASYTENTVINLTATASAGSRFAGWSGACSGMGACSVTMDAAKTVGALFEAIPSYALTVNRSGAGQVVSSPAGINCPDACSASYTENTVISLTATASAGSRFAGWSGACSGTGACSVTMTAAKTVGAMFTEIPRFTLTVSTTNGGTVSSSPVGIQCGSDCSEAYTENTLVRLSAEAPQGFGFAEWSGACTGAGVCEVSMTADKAVAARFEALPRHTLTVTRSGTGSGTVGSTPAGIDCGSTCAADYTENTVVNLSAQPVAGSTFGGWGGACTGAAGCEVTMSAARTVTATFAPAAMTSAVDFATDSSRTADGNDPGSVINPILSSARAHGDMTPVPNANADGKTLISANVFVPAFAAGQTFPVVLHSHGWGGAKEGTPRGTGLPTVLANEGYIVVSFSERGWGDSEGEIRIMDPAYEGQDAKAVIDWIVAEQQAGRLPVKMDGPNDPRIGTYGGSYGGGFQLNLAAEDPRVDALAPDITWHDLRYSLIPNGLIKAGWGNLLCAVGQARPNRDEMLIKACDALPGAANSFRTKEGIETVVAGFHDFVHRNSMDFYETNGVSPVAMSPYARRMPPVLLTQGMRDNLFNGLEATHNLKFLQGISPDVRLFTHQSGHLNVLLQQAGGPQTCGPVNLIGNASAVTRKWFARYLKDDMTALAGVPRVCISLEAGKAVLLDAVPEGGLASAAVTQTVTTQTAPPPANRVFVPLTTITTAGQVLAGIPRFKNVTVRCPIPAPGMCPPITPAAEPVAMVGFALRRGATTTLIDEQVTPIRTMGSPHAVIEFPMIAEALNVGDEIGLFFYTVHGQYQPAAASDGSNAPPAAGPNDQYQFSAASVELPIFTPPAGSVVP